MRKILHVVPVLDEANGVCRVANMLAREACARGDDAKVLTAREFLASPDVRCAALAEVWVHGLWLPCEWLACRRVLKMKGAGGGGPVLVRMTHGSLSPVSLASRGKWKKRLVAPIERRLMRRSDRIAATCAAELRWNRNWIGRASCSHELVDLKRFFTFGKSARTASGSGCGARPLHVLYLGRRHPLKGVAFLERAVARITADSPSAVALRVVGDHFGAELERDWEWCDVLCLPTLSENFGLVVAEALARGKRVITTDGAPAWETEETPGLVYLRGYREGANETRVRLLSDAIRRFVSHSGPILKGS